MGKTHCYYTLKVTEIIIHAAEANHQLRNDSHMTNYTALNKALSWCFSCHTLQTLTTKSWSNVTQNLVNRPTFDLSVGHILVISWSYVSQKFVN